MIFHHLSVAFLGMLALAQGKIYFKEQFDDSWTDRWVVSSKWKEPEQLGEWKWTAGKWHGDENDKGIQVCVYICGRVWFSRPVWMVVTVKGVEMIDRLAKMLAFMD